MNESDVLGKVSTGLFIGGEWRGGSDGRSIDVEDPATGKVLTSVADATVDDGVAALDAACAAQADWAATPPRERAEMLRSAFEQGGVHLVVAPIDYSENTRVLVDELREQPRAPAAPQSGSQVSAVSLAPQMPSPHSATSGHRRQLVRRV